MSDNRMTSITPEGHIKSFEGAPYIAALLARTANMGFALVSNSYLGLMQDYAQIEGIAAVQSFLVSCDAYTGGRINKIDRANNDRKRREFDHSTLPETVDELEAALINLETTELVKRTPVVDAGGRAIGAAAIGFSLGTIIRGILPS